MTVLIEAHMFCTVTDRTQLSETYSIELKAINFVVSQLWMFQLLLAKFACIVFTDYFHGDSGIAQLLLDSQFLSNQQTHFGCEFRGCFYDRIRLDADNKWSEVNEIHRWKQEQNWLANESAE